MASETLRLTTAQALIKFLDQQYLEVDGAETKLVHAVLGIFGHGNVTGLGEALESQDGLEFIRANNEQGMVHTATAFAKQSNRRCLMACTSSIGPGATNMVTGAATATINRLPVLLLPGDVFADRQPDPVLQQLEATYDHGVTVNDCFKPVSRYWDRVERPEQLMSALIEGFRVLTDPIEVGAVTICLPQDVQAEAWDFPRHFFTRRTWHLDRRLPTERALSAVVTRFQKASRPLVVAGGGVHYSGAVEELTQFARELGVPVAETQAGKSAMDWRDPMSVGGIGVTGTLVANRLAERADLVLAIGTRLTDFTTRSKSLFADEQSPIVHLNVSAFDGLKMDGLLLQADALEGLSELRQRLSGRWETAETYRGEIAELKAEWDAEVDRLYELSDSEGIPQTTVLGCLNRRLPDDAIVVASAGSLPGDLHRLWRCQRAKGYHLEYGYSCMGYEVAGALGAKLASPERDVYALVGDGSFLMLHSELVTALQEGVKIDIVLFDNHGFQCIDGLQRSQGCGSFGNELRYRDEHRRLAGDHLPIDYAAYGASLGVRTFQARSLDEFERALDDARREPAPTLIAVEVLPESMTGGYASWWRVGVAEVSREPKVGAAQKEMAARVSKARKY